MQVNNLKSYLANIGMSCTEFAKILDCNRDYLSNIANGNVSAGRRLAKDIKIATNGVIDLPVQPRNKKKKKKEQNELSDLEFGRPEEGCTGT